MSPNRGRRPASGTGGPSRSRLPTSAAEVRRLGLLVFGGGFVLLFAIVGIAAGIGHPDPSGGEIAIVEDVPGEAGTITEREFQRTLRQTALQAGLDKPPKPGDEQYDELKEAALGNLLDIAWVEGEAAEMGITVGDKRLEEELEKVKQQGFQSEAEFEEFLAESGYSDADVDRLLRVQVLSEDIQKKVNEDAPQPSGGEVESYYEAAKATQFTQQPSRDVRVIVNKDRAKAKRARERLANDSSPLAWERVARKFSEDEATKGSGGLQRGVAEGSLEEPLNKAVFNTPEGQVDGPLETEGGFYVFEVENTTPEEVQPLSDVEAQVEQQLELQAQQEAFNAFVSDFSLKWTSRTYCVSEFLTQRCANFEGDGHSETAPPGCYEANPEGGFPEACPAPVFQLVPALPGTVDPLAPRGTPLAQRPRPAGLEEVEEEEGAGLGGFTVPPGATP